MPSEALGRLYGLKFGTAPLGESRGGRLRLLAGGFLVVAMSNAQAFAKSLPALGLGLNLGLANA